MTKAKTAAKTDLKAHAVASTLLREDASGARWYRVTMSDGRVITMCVPGRE